MKAVIIGATGATGEDLVQLLLEDAAFTEIIVFVRKAFPIRHEKITEHIIDFDQVKTYKDMVKGDVFFSCLGTTLKAAGSKEAQWKIDYDYQFEFAQIAKENGIPTFVLVSSAMANPASSLFYMKMKGQLEEAVKALNFDRTLIFQPPSLIRKNTDRAGEKFGVKFIRFLNQFGIAKNQKPMPTDYLANSMIQKAKSSVKGIHVFTPNEI